MEGRNDRTAQAAKILIHLNTNDRPKWQFSNVISLNCILGPDKFSQPKRICMAQSKLCKFFFLGQAVILIYSQRVGEEPLISYVGLHENSFFQKIIPKSTRTRMVPMTSHELRDTVANLASPYWSLKFCQFDQLTFDHTMFINTNNLQLRIYLQTYADQCLLLSLLIHFYFLFFSRRWGIIANIATPPPYKVIAALAIQQCLVMDSSD